MNPASIYVLNQNHKISHIKCWYDISNLYTFDLTKWTTLEEYKNEIEAIVMSWIRIIIIPGDNDEKERFLRELNRYKIFMKYLFLDVHYYANSNKIQVPLDFIFLMMQPYRNKTYIMEKLGMIKKFATHNSYNPIAPDLLLNGRYRILRKILRHFGTSKKFICIGPYINNILERKPKICLEYIIRGLVPAESIELVNNVKFLCWNKLYEELNNNGYSVHKDYIFDLVSKLPEKFCYNIALICSVWKSIKNVNWRYSFKNKQTPNDIARSCVNMVKTFTELGGIEHWLGLFYENDFNKPYSHIIPAPSNIHDLIDKLTNEPSFA